MSQEFPNSPRKIGEFFVLDLNLGGKVVYKLLDKKLDKTKAKLFLKELNEFLKNKKYYSPSLDESNYSCKVVRPYVLGFFEVKVVGSSKIEAIYSQLRYFKPNSRYFSTLAFDFKEFLKDLEEFLLEFKLA